MKWLNVRNVSSADKSADIYINGQIGESWYDENAVAASDFIRTVNALGELHTINLYINSPGGSVSDGTAIHNFLKRHKATVNVEVLGEASSIASVIAMAGDIISMPANAIMMIHDPMSPMMGYFNADELRNLADRLDVVKDAVMSSYTSRTGKSVDEVKALMSAETYMTGKQAVEMGFADNLLDSLDAVACTDKDTLNEMFVNLASKSAKKLIAAIPTEQPTPINLHEIAMQQCSDAGFAALAVNLVKRCKTVDDITANVKLATDIQNICVAAEIPEGAPQVLAHLGDTVAMMREMVTQVQASSEGFAPVLPNETPVRAVINIRDIYEKRNNKQTK